MKITKIEEKEIAKHYRIQLKSIENARLMGVAGRIEFMSYQ